MKARLYLDSADVAEIRASNAIARFPEAIAGITTNPHLFLNVVDRYLERIRHAQFFDVRPCTPEHVFARFSVLVGQDLKDLFDGNYDISLPLHQGVFARPQEAMLICKKLVSLVPSCLIKIPFLPDNPGFLFLVRDMESSGLRVNVTATFSVRQVAVVSLLAGASRTNVFVGRITRGLNEVGAGEWVATRAQQFLTKQRAISDCRTHLIAASVHDPSSLIRVTGCDYVTSSPTTVASFLGMAGEDSRPLDFRQDGKATRNYRSGPGGSYLKPLAELDEGLISFLSIYGRSAEYKELQNADKLYQRFSDEGFGDVFYHPSDSERQMLGISRIPDFSHPIASRCTIDAMFSLLANADFSKSQELVDQRIVF